MSDNELIAEIIIGWRLCDCGTLPEHYVTGPANFHVCDVKDLKYDKSWDALMPALSKARELIKLAGWGTPREKEARKRLEAAFNEVYNLNIEAVSYCLARFAEWYKKMKDADDKESGI